MLFFVIFHAVHIDLLLIGGEDLFFYGLLRFASPEHTRFTRLIEFVFCCISVCVM